MFDGSGRQRLRLAIVSTYDELCGIAGYTRALTQQLSPFADLTVFDLDQSLLRSAHRVVQRQADRHIASIAATFDGFDCVNLQLEFGTLGRTPRQIARRLRQLVLAAPALSVTFHTIFGHERPDRAALCGHLLLGRFGEAGAAIAERRRTRLLGEQTYALLRRRQRTHPVTPIVHTSRDARLLRDVFGLRDVEHHPLSFISASQAQAIRTRASRADFPLLAGVPAEAKLIGSFGFLSSYKGFETALRALRCLPDDHHLLIFGGVHPQAIRRGVAIDPYVRTLLDEAHIGQTVLDAVLAGASAAKLPVTLGAVTLGAGANALLAPHPDDLQRRVHFLGVQDDDGFMRAMALCDAVVLPYQEVGQSSSGPLALALEMGCRVLASRTHAFLQFARYHPQQIEFFDIGNYAELAGLIRSGRPAPRESRVLSYNTATNAALYLRANRPYPAGDAHSD
jgi:glycosyltransferase involved in cell wall biosynthesis